MSEMIDNVTTTATCDNSTVNSPKLSFWVVLGKVVGTIVNVLIIALGVIMILVTTCGVKDETGLNIFGHTLMQVLSESMEGEDMPYDIATMPTGSMVIMKAIPTEQQAKAKFLSELKEGDVVTFLSLEGASIGKIVSHRITEVQQVENNGTTTYLFTTRGDNNPESVVEKFTGDSIKGQIVWANANAGVIYSTLMNSSMILFLVVIPAAIMFIFELFKVITLINSVKLAKAKESSQSEIELLRKQLEQLTKANNTDVPIDQIDTTAEN